MTETAIYCNKYLPPQPAAMPTSGTIGHRVGHAMVHGAMPSGPRRGGRQAQQNFKNNDNLLANFKIVVMVLALDSLAYMVNIYRKLRNA